MKTDYINQDLFCMGKEKRGVLSGQNREALVEIWKKKEEGKICLLRICYFPDFSSTGLPFLGMGT